jgi:hypothetical protein
MIAFGYPRFGACGSAIKGFSKSNLRARVYACETHDEYLFLERSRLWRPAIQVSFEGLSGIVLSSAGQPPMTLPDIFSEVCCRAFG